MWMANVVICVYTFNSLLPFNAHYILQYSLYNPVDRGLGEQLGVLFWVSGVKVAHRAPHK